MSRGAKRVIDLLVASALVVLCAPLMIAAMLLVMVIDPGVPIFVQVRTGFGNRPFRMYKLRTMVVDAEARLEHWLDERPEHRDQWQRFRRLAEDPRLIAGIGRILRRSSIDELPQLWNVIVGDMSLVGPRPLELEVAKGLPVGLVERRGMMRPGMTGLWQVSGRSDLDLERMLMLDDEYVRNWSLLTDASILLRTPRAVLSTRGAF